MQSIRIWRLAGAAIMLPMISTGALADALVVYGAGSLRETIGQIAADFQTDLTVAPTIEIWKVGDRQNLRRCGLAPPAWCHTGPG